MKLLFLIFIIEFSLFQSLSTVSDTKTYLLNQILKGAPQSEIRKSVSILENENQSLLTFPNLWNQLNGKWLMLYTNNARNVQEARMNGIIESVEQNIDNSVVNHCLKFGGPAPFELILVHNAKISSSSDPAQLSVDLERVDAVIAGRKVKTPLFPGPSFLRRGYFDVSSIIFILNTTFFLNSLIFHVLDNIHR
jgi:hypothetical protein